MLKTGDSAVVVELTLEMEGHPELMGEKCLVVSVSADGSHAKVCHSETLEGMADYYHVQTSGLRAVPDMPVAGPEAAPAATEGAETAPSASGASESVTEAPASPVTGA
jgi:hypothetical protein